MSRFQMALPTMSLRIIGILFAVSGASLGLLWLTQIPLGVPGEWTWDRHSFAEVSARELIWSFGPAVIAACGYGAFVRWQLPSADQRSQSLSFGKLCGLTFAGFAVVWLMQSASPGPYADLQRGWVAYNPGASGYFFEAVRQKENTDEFLAGYESMMAGEYIPVGKTKKQRDVYHIGTHPPGLILWHRELIGACQRFPAFTGVVLATQPHSTALAFQELEKATKLLPRRLTDAERAALWLSVLLTHFAAAATVIPLFSLVQMDFGTRTAWKTAAFWPMIPAIAIFLPKSDALFPLLGLLFLWTWRSALRRRSAVLAVLSGCVMWLGMLLSLALLPVALFAALLTMWETFGRVESDVSSRCWKHNAYLAFLAIAAFVAAIALFYRATQANLLMIWLENFRNHAGFYEQESHVRTYWKWLTVNPLELAFAVGVPVFLLAAVKCIDIAKMREARRFRQNGPLCSGVLVIGLLWLTGKNMGEAGRLWLFLMPWLLWMSAGIWDSRTEKTDEETWAPFSLSVQWLFLLSMQAIVCLMTVGRVQGFTFGS